MNPSTTAIAVASLHALVACGGSPAPSGDAVPLSSASGAAPASDGPRLAATCLEFADWQPSEEPETSEKCAARHGVGKGEFGEMCKLKGPAPITARWTEGFAEDPFGHEPKPEFEVSNKTDLQIDWADIAMYYYDAKGNQIPSDEIAKGSCTFYDSANGSGVLAIEPGETKKVALGWPKSEWPKGTVSVEIEVMGWGSDAEQMYFTPFSERTDLDHRPRGGFTPVAPAR